MIITLTGSNSFSLQAGLAQLTGAFVAEHGDIAVERLDGEAAFERLQEALQSSPFLASKKLVIIRSASVNKQFTEHVESLLNMLPDSTDLIIVEPKIDKRSSYYAWLKKHTTLHEHAELDEQGLARYLVEAAKAQGSTLSLSDARYLVERVGTSQQLLANELEKLVLYNPHISRASIDELTEAAPQSTIFDLLEAAFAGNGGRALALYKEQREQKVDPSQIIALLAWQLRILALLKTAGERSEPAIASQAKVSPFTLKKSSGIARRLTLAELKQLINNLLVLDVRSKRESIDLDGAIQNFLLRLSQ